MQTIDQSIMEILRHSDAIVLGAALQVAKAMVAGMDNYAALKAGNAVLVAGGREPLSEAAVLAKLKEVRYGQAC